MSDAGDLYWSDELDSVRAAIAKATGERTVDQEMTGFVLTHEDGRKCIVDMSAVRWFHDTDGRKFFAMMHPNETPSNAGIVRLDAAGGQSERMES